MNNFSLMPRAGAPRAGDTVWSALPDAPVVLPRRRRRWWFRRGALGARNSLQPGV